MAVSDEKWRPFNRFSVQGTGGSPTGPDSENVVGDQDIGKSRRERFQGIFALGMVWGEVSSYAVTPLIVALSLGQSDTTRLRP
jgi:hypothetical protein